VKNLLTYAQFLKGTLPKFEYFGKVDNQYLTNIREFNYYQKRN